MFRLHNLRSRVVPRRPAPRPRFTPTLRPLEDRTVPAGVVNATFAAGVLTLTALNDPTDVNITRTNHQNITLDAAGANTITVTANDGETGSAFTGGPFAGMTAIRLVMGLGNDTVTLTDAALTGTVTFLGGSGNNRLNIDGAGNFSGLAGPSPGNVTVGGVSVTNGDGDDTFTVGGGSHTINGNVVIRNGEGFSNTSFGFLGADVTNVTGAVGVTNLNGNDFFAALGTSATFTGPITLSHGNGGSDTTFGAGTTAAVGGITVTCGAGNDDFNTNGTTFTVGTPTARRNLTIRNGTGGGSTDQNFNATTNTINGNLSVTAAAGDDDFSVNGTNFVVRGNLTVSTGSGGGTTSITPTQVVDIDGAVVVTAGQGNDTLDFGGATSVDVGSVSLTSGNGSSTLTFSGATATVTGAVRHTHLAGTSTTTFGAASVTIDGTITSTHGDGTDTLEATGSVFKAAAITIRNGAGGSTTEFGATTSNTLTGNIGIVNGDGSDTFTAGGGTFVLGAPTARRNLTIANGIGGSTTEFLGSTTTIEGSVAVTNGDGFDSFDVGGTTFAVTGAGNVTIANGIGGGTTTIAAGAGSIGGKLTVTATDGADVVELTRLTMTGATAINTGNGNDTIDVDNSTFNGLFGVVTGAGADRVLIEDGSVNDGVSTVYNAAVNVNVGGGDDQVLIGVIGDANDFGDFNAGVTLTGGLDLDIVQALANPANTFAVPPTVTGFEQGT